MWMFIAAIIFIAIISAVGFGAWLAVLDDMRDDAPICPICLSRMRLTPSKGASGFVYRCERCDPDSSDSLQSHQLDGWIQSHLRPPR